MPDRLRLCLSNFRVFSSHQLDFPRLPDEEKGVPEAPDNLRIFTRYDGATAVAELLWQDQSDNEVGFEVLRSDNGKDFRVVAVVGADSAHFNDKVGKYITGGFSYKIRAFNEAGRSEDSNVVSIWL